MQDWINKAWIDEAMRLQEQVPEPEPSHHFFEDPEGIALVQAILLRKQRQRLLDAAIYGVHEGRVQYELGSGIEWDHYSSIGRLMKRRKSDQELRDITANALHFYELHRDWAPPIRSVRWPQYNAGPQEFRPEWEWPRTSIDDKA